MARKSVSVRRNADGVLTLKSGRQVEHVATDGIAHVDVFEKVKWAGITMGVYLSDLEATELLDKARRGVR
jgi:hypothetical protein